MSMTKPAYPALFHYMQKRMADVTYPITKEALLSQIGDRTVFVDWDVEVPLRTFIEPIQREAFSCAAEFYCMLIAFL